MSIQLLIILGLQCLIDLVLLTLFYLQTRMNKKLMSQSRKAHAAMLSMLELVKRAEKSQ